MSRRTPAELAAIAERTAADIERGKKGFKLLLLMVLGPLGLFISYCMGAYAGFSESCLP